jgi:hypothetical protein
MLASVLLLAPFAALPPWGVGGLYPLPAWGAPPDSPTPSGHFRDPLATPLGDSWDTPGKDVSRGEPPGRGGQPPNGGGKPPSRGGERVPAQETDSPTDTDSPADADSPARETDSPSDAPPSGMGRAEETDSPTQETDSPTQETDSPTQEASDGGKPAVIGTPVVGNSGASLQTKLTLSATCPSGNSNVVAVACVATHKQGTTAVNLGAVTWKGAAMTAVAAGVVESSSNGSYARLYVLPNPTCDGTAGNFVINTQSGTNFLVGGILFLKDTNQTTPFDTPVATATGTSGTPSVNVGSATSDLVVDCVSARNSNTNLAAGPGQTGKVSQTTNATPSSNPEVGHSTEAGAASVTMSWTGTSSVSWASMGASFNPASGSDAVGKRKHAPPVRILRNVDPLENLGYAAWVASP